MGPGIVMGKNYAVQTVLQIAHRFSFDHPLRRNNHSYSCLTFFLIIQTQFCQQALFCAALAINAGKEGNTPTTSV